MMTCTICGQEVRYGTRPGTMGRRPWARGVPAVGWWHRDPVDHNARFGVPSVHPAESARMRSAWNEDDETPETPMEEEQVEPELPAMPVDTKTRLFVGRGDSAPILVEMPGGARIVVNKARKAGWDTTASFARGPWLHSALWTSTGIRSTVLVRMRRGPDHAVAMWRTDKKGAWTFHSAWTWNKDTGIVPANSKTLTERINA